MPDHSPRPILPPDRWARVLHIFQCTCDAEPGAREAILAAECGDDVELRLEVLSLLDADRDAALCTAGAILSASIHLPPDHPPEQSGDRIGVYTLLSPIGEGGFGSVWLAQRRDPALQVALKLIKPGADSRAAVERFQRERQILAELSHPNVAHVLDGGLTDGGRPYFVMELVRGETLTAYCDRHTLDIPARLALFSLACHGVAHANRNGVIHRDLKPSNILVTTQDGQSVVKVIDFGIAQPTSAPAPSNPSAPPAPLIGTYEYMSPEQAAGLPLDIRTDVYSLGVVLYQLLCGLLPFERPADPLHATRDLLGSIRSAAPSTLRKRLSSLPSAQRLEALARQRATTPAKLTRALGAELEAIVRKAMQPQRESRYETASDLAADISNYLHGRPVLAVPRSARYLAFKFARAHRAAVISAAAAVLTLAFAAAFSTAMAFRERDARRDAEQRQQESQQLVTFLESTIGDMNHVKVGRIIVDDLLQRLAESLEKDGVPEPQRSTRLASLRADIQRLDAAELARSLVDRTILTPALELMDNAPADRPLVDATFRQAIAHLYATQGANDRAAALQQRVVDLRRKLSPHDAPETLTSLTLLGKYFIFIEATQKAEPLLNEVLDTSRRLYGQQDPRTLLAVSEIGILLASRRDYPQAESLFRDLLQRQTRVLGPDHPDTLTTLDNLGFVINQQGRYTAAEACYRQTVDIRARTLGPVHRDTLTSKANLARCLLFQDRTTEAEPILREILSERRRIFGDSSPEAVGSMNDLLSTLGANRKFDEAESLSAELMDKCARVFARYDPNLLTIYGTYAGFAQSQGRLSEAAEYRRLVYEHLRQTRDPLDTDAVIASINLAACLYANGRLSEATTLTLETLTNASRADLTAILGKFYGQMLLDAREYSLAQPYLCQDVEACEGAFQSRDIRAMDSLLNWGSLQRELGNLPEASYFLSQALNLRTQVLCDDHPKTLTALTEWGDLLLRQGRFQEADAACTAALESRRRVDPVENLDMTLTLMNAALARSAVGEHSQALALADHASAMAARLLPPDHPLFLRAQRAQDQVTAAAMAP